MSIATNREEMCAMLSNKVVVFPSYNNRDDLVKLFDYGYAIVDSKLVDPMTGTSSSIVALMHTHPNGSAPTTNGGDGDFAAMYIPYKPSYVMLIKQEDLSLSSICFVVGSKTPFMANKNGYINLTTVILNDITISNITKNNNGFHLIEFTKQNKSNFKQIITNFK